MAAKRKKKNIYLTKEPDWTKLSKASTEEKKVASFKHADFFVHYEIDNKSKASAMKLWIKEDSGWDKVEQKKINKLPDYYFGTAGKIAFMAKKLGYIPAAHKEYIEGQRLLWVNASDNLVEEKEDDEPKNIKPKVSIQTRMAEQVGPLCGEWEAILDLITGGGFDLAKFDPFNEMRSYESGLIKPNHAKIIKDSFANDYSEAIEVVKWKDDDIKEAFSHLTAKTRKAYLAFYEKINTACDTYIITGKAQRKTRKPKAVSKERLVTKLKYKLNDSDLGIASINPIELIDSQEVWVYNTKTRKIGVFYKDDLTTGMTVKGTTLLGFNETTSRQRTLRKPAEHLKDFKGNARTKYKKAFNALTTSDIKMKGRLNEHIIILKAF